LTTSQEPDVSSVRGRDLVPASGDRDLLPLVWVRAANDCSTLGFIGGIRIGSRGTVLDDDIIAANGDDGPTLVVRVVVDMVASDRALGDRIEEVDGLALVLVADDFG